MALPFRCIIMQLWIYQAELYLAVRSIYDSLILSEKLCGGILDSRNKLLQDRILTVCLHGIKQTKVSLCIIALKGGERQFLPPILPGTSSESDNRKGRIRQTVSGPD